MLVFFFFSDGMCEYMWAAFTVSKHIKLFQQLEFFVCMSKWLFDAVCGSITLESVHVAWPNHSGDVNISAGQRNSRHNHDHDHNDYKGHNKSTDNNNNNHNQHHHHTSIRLASWLF